MIRECVQSHDLNLKKLSQMAAELLSLSQDGLAALFAVEQT